MRKLKYVLATISFLMYTKAMKEVRTVPDNSYRDVFSRKLRYYMAKSGKTQMDLMQDLGLGSSTVSNWCNGKMLPRMGKLQMLADYFGINKSDLIEENHTPEAEAIPPGFQPMPSMTAVPLVGQIACGDPITAEENLEGVVNIPEAWGAAFVLTCRGDSMEPKIKDGDLVAIRQQPEVENGQIAAVRIDNEATLKKVYLYPDRLELRPINPDYESIVLYGEDINTASIEGRAVGLCRGL